MSSYATSLLRSRRPIVLSLLFALGAAGYFIYLGVLAFVLVRIGNIGEAFGGSHEPHPLKPLEAFLSLCYFIAPLLYFVLSYLCCRPQTTGEPLRRLFILSVAFLALSVLGAAFATPVDTFSDPSSSRLRIVVGVALASTPFLFATICLFYRRWGPPSHSTNVA